MVIQNTVLLNTKKYISASVFFGNSAYSGLNDLIDSSGPSKLFVLTDSNTRQLCVKQFLEKLDPKLTPTVLEIPNGEKSKSIEQCSKLWEQLSHHGADRHSLLINLGGGVVTDIGGFVAGTFIRGLKFVNVPTSLLAMVDAAIGGKTGIDFGSLKNQIGIMNFPEMVLIYSVFLKSLPEAEISSGWAEVLKHGLISDRNYWDLCYNLNCLDITEWEHIIETSVTIKLEVVEADTFEKNSRKVLNFGHTFGHAIESFRLDHSEKALSHGASIGIGMVLAAYFSVQLKGLDLATAQKIRTVVAGLYGIEHFDSNSRIRIEELLAFDKKNSNGLTNFVLLESVGQAIIDNKVPLELYDRAFDFYESGV